MSVQLIQNKRYVVRNDHPFHAGKAGIFEFMGGPDADVVVLCHDKHSSGSKNYFAVGINDIDRQED